MNSKDMTFGDFENKNLFTQYDCNETESDISSLERKIQQYNSSKPKLHYLKIGEEDQL